MNAPPLLLQLGASVRHHGQTCRIKAILDVSRVLLQPDDPDERPRAANINELAPLPDPADAKKLPPLTADDEKLTDERLEEAHRRLEIIRPLLLQSTSHSVVEHAREHRLHPATLYRWMKDYRQRERLSSLVPRYDLRGRPLEHRLNPEVEKITKETIEEHFLQKNRPSVSETAREVKNRCRDKNLEHPCHNTVRNRILALSERRVTRARHGTEKARRFRHLRGSLPGADQPWAIVHVDHTKLDLVLVDRETRQPIGRPNLTLAEDACTRMILGLYLSLDDGSALSAGMCLSHAILPKENWLARRGVEGDWPVWGIPEMVHVDNAKEFRGRMVEKACKELDISITFRRRKTPSDGGRIERLIKTIAQEVHQLPGTTFSNPQDRGEYDSEKEAALTLDEAERIIVDWIVNVYHRRPHQALGGKPPIKAWEDGLLGTPERPTPGLPARHSDEIPIRLLFLPFEERTVQPYGVKLDDITYWNDRLRHWIGGPPAKKSKAPRKFVIRRDPRDISRVWFFDPQLREHIELNYRDLSRPPMSLWELRAIRERLRAEGAKAIDENAIFEARERMRRVAEQAIRDTKSARRERERAQRHRENATKSVTKSAPNVPPVAAPAPESDPKEPKSPKALAFPEIDN